MQKFGDHSHNKSTQIFLKNICKLDTVPHLTLEIFYVYDIETTRKFDIYLLRPFGTNLIFAIAARSTVRVSKVTSLEPT